MTGEQLDLWAVLSTALATISEDRCISSPGNIGDLVDKLVDTCVAISYDRDATERIVSRVSDVIRAAYALGRASERYNNQPK